MLRFAALAANRFSAWHILHAEVFPKPRPQFATLETPLPRHQFIGSAPPLALPNPSFPPTPASPALAFTTVQLLCVSFAFFLFFFVFFGSVFEARLLTRMWRARLCPMRTVPRCPDFPAQSDHKRRPAEGQRCWRLRSASPAVCRASDLPRQRSLLLPALYLRKSPRGKSTPHGSAVL